MYSFLISDEDYCDKPVGTNTTGVIKIYTPCKYVDPGVLCAIHIRIPGEPGNEARLIGALVNK